ncbi:MAG TPA: phosphate ABC transporter ATP-binding protein PstB [Thermoplasmata archaeon]|nr:phosphate ABC transporter ATP-binding protein PstB [Thermoplasmata archaeon]
MTGKLEVEGLSAWYGRQRVLYEISLDLPQGGVTSVIGPSGCGKTTFLRCLNRLHDELPGARVAGRVLLDGVDIRRQEATEVRCRIGMVFQKPTPFANLSIYENVAAGPRLLGVRRREELDRVVWSSLVRAGLWEEVRDDVDALGTSLSGGQQQRLCIARAIAVEPEVLLMDEPCSSLDPVATARVERLIAELKARYTIVVVTHNLAQARRISDRTAFFYLGKLVEFDRTAELFEHPREQLTANYVAGQFG